jgi:DNA-binding transcriptional MerR regulator
MTRIVTSRVGEVLGINIATIQKAAQKLDENSELQELEENLAELDKAVSELKSALAGLPYKHSV